MERRRSDQRYERELPIDFSYEGRSYSGRTRNISLGGVFIQTEVPLPFGSKVVLKLKLPAQRDGIEVGGQVRWLEMEDGLLRGLGVRFEGLRARDVWALNKYFEQAQDAP